MPQDFKDSPILNSPYSEPNKHWEMNNAGEPTGNCDKGRRISKYMVPVPPPKNTRSGAQVELELEDRENETVNRIRTFVSKWRQLPDSQWEVTKETKELLKHWRGTKRNPRPFFCQIEAVETLIWLTEVAPRTEQGKSILEILAAASREANSLLPQRVASKMATGSGKTTVMAMMIAYYTVNHARHPADPRFTADFLVVTPGITIRDRLRVLLPGEPDNYYQRDVVPNSMMSDVNKANVQVTNFHTFIQRKRKHLQDAGTKGTAILRGNSDTPLDGDETIGQMLLRVVGNVSKSKRIVVFNDEGHHCYRRKHDDSANIKKMRQDMDADELKEIKIDDENGRIWINGLEGIESKFKLLAIHDMSATPFFLRGSGYPEGTLFPWTVSDFALIDAVESGIVKIPRVPVSDGTEQESPVYRKVYAAVKTELSRITKNRKSNKQRAILPAKLQGALEMLYQNYEEIRAMWEHAKIEVPPVFIIVCNNSDVAKLMHDYIAGYKLNNQWISGKIPGFNNVGENGPLPRPKTLLVDSRQMESGEALTGEFKDAAKMEIEQFKQDFHRRAKVGNVNKINDGDILREVMNTVGKPGKLGEQVRCVIAVSMLNEGWDTHTVTHVLGVRAFRSQLLCEQVVGRALRRLNYEVDDDKQMLTPEYADVFGVPFAFMHPGSDVPPPPPKKQSRVRYLPERSHLEIQFPNVIGYGTIPRDGAISANFSGDSLLILNEQDIFPANVKNEGLAGKPKNFNVDKLRLHRKNEIIYHLAAATARKIFDDADGIPPARFQELVPIVRTWIDDYLKCKGGTFMGYLMMSSVTDIAANRISRACKVGSAKELLMPVFDQYSPKGSTLDVDFLTTKNRLHETRHDKSHVNIAVCDSSWEMELCKMLEDDDGVIAYVRNERLGFSIPYMGDDQQEHRYFPDFIALIDDKGIGMDKENALGNGKGGNGEYAPRAVFHKDFLRIVIETKGYRDGNAQAKADTMSKLWIPGMNNSEGWGRWEFLEIMDMQNARKKLAQFTGTRVHSRSKSSDLPRMQL